MHRVEIARLRIIAVMKDPTHFRITYWPTEILLLAFSAAFAWLTQAKAIELEEPFAALSLPAAFLFGGTAVGGLVGRTFAGAVMGTTLFCAFAIWVFGSNGF